MIDYSEFLTGLPLKYFMLSVFLFVLGLSALILNKDNLVKILISFEMMVLATVINFNLFSSIHDTSSNHNFGSLFVLVILAVAAAEAGIGLAIFFLYFKKKKDITVESANSLNG